MNTYMITGGAGFIGSNLVHRLLERDDARVVVLDLLTYAGNLDNLAGVMEDERFHFIQGDLCDRMRLDEVFADHQPATVFNLAAESHVDRSIDGPRQFVRTNVMGTFELLDAARVFWGGLPTEARGRFRVVHVSTDEVYGSLGAEGLFTECTAHAPNSPYAATKAGADHLARAYFHTYGLPTITTNCSNNFGPHQFPEKLIPLVILNALEGKPLPIYGDGKNVRDWLYVGDHCDALALVAAKGEPGQSYNVGARNERTTTQMVETICDLLDELRPTATNPSTGEKGVRTYRELIQFVKDRPGHDLRYAIDPSKIRDELGWTPTTSFEEGMRRTIRWYLDNPGWCDRINQGTYQRERLGLTEGKS